MAKREAVHDRTFEGAMALIEPGRSIRRRDKHPTRTPESEGAFTRRILRGGEFPDFQRGLGWYDGTNVGVFPVPPLGAPQWGGLPHSAIKDLEVREIPGGYELWMSCVSRGLAVLTVQRPTAAVNAGETPAARLELAQNRPNPFRAGTQIRFGLHRTESVRLDIFDVTGRLVRRLVDETLPAGNHAVEWDGRTNGMASMPNGVYLYRLEAGGEAVERRMLLLH
jgi:hypothetical protein